VAPNTRSPVVARPATVRRAYDVCVIGSQLGGVAAGALLARRGYRVLHVDLDGHGTGYTDGGWRIPWGPAIVPALRALPAAEATLVELGLATDVARLLEPARPSLQILLPRHRIDLPAARAERTAELRREWPVDAARLDAGLSALRSAFDAEQPFLASFPPLPPRGLAERWRLHRARRLSHPGDTGGPAPLADLEGHPLAVALRAAWPFLSFLDGPPPALGMARALGSVLQGSLRPAGGESAVAALLRRRIADSRGELLGGEGEPAPVSGLELAGSKAGTLKVRGGESRYAARAFVFAGEVATLGALVGNPDRVRKWLEPATSTSRLQSLAWVVRGDALPAPLGDLALAVPAGGIPVLLQSLPAFRAGPRGHEASPTERVLVAATPARSGSDPDPEAAARLRSAVAEFLPFLDRATVYASDPGSRPGAGAFHPLLASRPDRRLGVGGVTTVSPIGNLFLAGREVLPGLGTEGQFHAAWQAAAAVERHLGSKNRPK
jgi:phytoene dehydrogenase-like protein